MKRDLELVRRIMRDAEALPPGRLCSDFNYEGKEEAETLEHVALLVQAGYLEGIISRDSKGMPRKCLIRRVTWQGHEFLANGKSDSI